MKLFNLGSPIVGLALLLSGVIADGPHGIHHARHTAIARRAEGNLELWERGPNSRWSFYDVGLGACGKYNGPSDFIVALNSDQFDVGDGYPGPQCFKYIIMEYNGKTARAQIMDRCPGCGYNGLDLSKGLFAHFDSLSEGIIYGSWRYDGGGGSPAPPPKPAPPPRPKTTYRPQPPTTTRHLPIPTPSIPKITTRPSVYSSSTTSTRRYRQSTSSAAESTSSSKSSDHFAAAKSSGAPAPTGLIDQANEVENLNDMNLALIGLAGVAAAGAGAD